MSEAPADPGFKDHFSTSSADYARYRPRYPDELADWLAAAAPSQALALDCGCGAGQLSTLLARRFERVVATDASASQIAHAQPHARVSYRVAPAEHSGLDDSSVDLLSAAQAAHWFDLPRFHAEARRVLRPRGCIALVTYGVASMPGACGELLRELHDRVLGPYWPPERRLVIDGYRDLDFPFDEIAAPPLDVLARWDLDELLGYVRTWSALRQAEAALGSAPYDEFARQLRAAWGDAGVRRDIAWPLRVRAGRLS